MDLMQTIALSAGLAWASGIRLYAAVFIAGMLGTLYPDAAIRLLAFVALLFVQIYFILLIFICRKFGS